MSLMIMLALMMPASHLGMLLRRLWRTLTGHERGVVCVKFSPDGLTLASCSADKTARLWNVETGEERAKLEGHTGVSLRTQAAAKLAAPPCGECC